MTTTVSNVLGVEQVISLSVYFDSILFCWFFLLLRL